MANQNSSNTDININADGFSQAGGTTKRKLTLSGADVAIVGSGTNVYTMPSTTDTLVGRASTDTLTNKDLSSTTNTMQATTLGYAQSTSNFSVASGTATQVTGLTTTVTIPSGSRKVKITAFARDLFNSSSTSAVFMEIWDGTVGSGTQLSATIGFANGGASAGIAMAVVTPSAGSKTYNVSLRSAGSGTALIEAGSTFPSFILVELI